MKAARFLVLAGMRLLTGCNLGPTGRWYTMSYGWPTVDAGNPISKGTAATLQPGVTTQGDVVAELGRPALLFADPRISAYTWAGWAKAIAQASYLRLSFAGALLELPAGREARSHQKHCRHSEYITPGRSRELAARSKNMPSEIMLARNSQVGFDRPMRTGWVTKASHAQRRSGAWSNQSC